MTLDSKLSILKEKIKKHTSAVIAFSGGVDSTFLARICKDVIGENLLLVTATSSTYPPYELAEAKQLAQKLALSHKIIVSEEINIPGFANNPPDRCYYCKSELFKLIQKTAHEHNIQTVFDGSNFDDLDDYRPGRRALAELGIQSPLCDAKLTKDEIRTLSEKYGLLTADKPAYACLASRFPYGEKITKTKLNRVALAEQHIRQLGFTQFRVRSHKDLARLEFVPDEMENAWLQKHKLQQICKEAGFTFSSIDLTGYRTGAMNESLDLLPEKGDIPE